MKKTLFFAIAAAGMLAACSNNDSLDATNNGISELSQEKIQLGVSTTASVSTRGTGTVGGLKDEDNVWAGQDLWIYMLKKDSMEVQQYVDPNGNGTDIFNNTKFIAPKGQAGESYGIASTANGFVGYYPVNGQSDFWGYRVDDAVTLSGNNAPAVKMLTADGTETDNATEATQRVVDVTINGTQDIMAGKAELEDGDAEKLGAGERANDYYSAFAARKGVQPNINFKHLLTRFTFNVKAGNKSAAGNGDNTGAVTVTGLSVGSRTNGQLIVAHTGEIADTSLLTFKDPTMTQLVLCERQGDDHNTPLVAISKENNNTVPLTWNNDNDWADTISIGEALLVAPGETVYPLTINLKQSVVTNVTDAENPNKEDKVLQYKAFLKLNNNAKFEMGKSYDVTITIYGLEKIVVTATLNPWLDGGKIDIDDDKDPESTFTEPSEPGEIL